MRASWPGPTTRSVAPHALPDGVRFLRGDQRPAPRAPTATETAIELPWWLIISPNQYGRFLNAGGPVTHGVDRTELWHTRLAVTTGDEIDEHREHPRRTGRAIWTVDPELPDYLNGNTDVPQPEDGATLGQPFLAPMAIRDRVDLLSNSADFRPNNYVPEPFRLNNLMLSALGGWLDATGAWPEGITSLISWRHRATQGRDHYVRIVRKGYYLPTGHPAAQVQISERKFERRNGVSAAYLQHRTFLITRRPVKDYPGFHQQADGRSFPFRSIRLTTLVTPNIDKSPLVDLPGQPNFDADPASPYIPYLAGTNDRVLFHCVGTDWEGRSIDFTTPLVFVEASLGDDDVAFSELGRMLQTGTRSTTSRSTAPSGPWRSRVRRLPSRHRWCRGTPALRSTHSCGDARRLLPVRMRPSRTRISRAASRR